LFKCRRVLKICRDINKKKVIIFKAPVTNKLFWCLNEQPASIKLKGVDKEENVVMRIIEEAGNKGIWNKDIRTKSGLNPTDLKKILKVLEGKNLIKSVLSVSVSYRNKVFFFS
jgi:DNA-directed RNA polymerase III subunit RPC6